ncbi:MAG: nitrophenyl compound nitroreductase subunit ArsF family protein [Bacteroidota bacterium]
MRKKLNLLATIAIISILFSCTTNLPKENTIQNDSSAVTIDSTTTQKSETTDTSKNESVDTKKSAPKTALATVYIYNFHVTNRCVSCIAIEEATTKALNQYFAEDMKSGKIKRKILNVDDEANKAITEKYEVFGSGILIVKSLNGKETKADLTGEGFKYAKNKEDKFIEILKNKITELLK